MINTSTNIVKDNTQEIKLNMMDLHLIHFAGRWRREKGLQEACATAEIAMRFYFVYSILPRVIRMRQRFRSRMGSTASHAWASVNQVELSVGCVAEGTGQDRPSAWSTDNVRVTSDRWWRTGTDPSCTSFLRTGEDRGGDKVLLNSLTTIVRVSHLRVSLETARRSDHMIESLSVRVIKIQNK